jgi:hypothetical protein
MPPNASITKTISAKPISAEAADEAERIVSLSSPLTEPSNPSSDDDGSISARLTPEQKVSGGGYSGAGYNGRGYSGAGYNGSRYGGSLYASLLRTTYTLAPAAALLATASIVLKKSKRSKRTKRLNKRSPKTRKMRKN